MDVARYWPEMLIPSNKTPEPAINMLYYPHQTVALSCYSFILNGKQCVSMAIVL